MSDPNAELLAARRKEELYWADVKAGKAPDPVTSGLAAADIRDKATLAKEVLRLEQAINRQKALIDKLQAENTDLRQRLETVKARAKAPAPKKAKGG